MRIYPASEAYAGDVPDDMHWRDRFEMPVVTVLGVVVRPLDWVIAALAAAFIAAGIVVLVPLGSSDTSVATIAPPPARDTVRAARVEDTEPSSISADDNLVRKVQTETIRVDVPAVEAVDVAGPADAIGGPAIIEGAEAEAPRAPLQLASFDINDGRIPVGCGLTLTEAGDQTRNLFYHRLPSADGASEGYLIVDNAAVKLSRTAVSGGPLGFGQYPVQTFESGDGSVSAIVELSFLPLADDSESLQVDTGRLIVTHADGRGATLTVSGDAGC